MTILKCKMCGGNIQVDGEAHGICDSCGCEVTLPKIDDDRRADMYNRGNYFRLMGNFDEAYSAYEHIIAEDNQDAEAHWNLMLCRYGILYEYDTRKREYIPTCSRLNPKSVLEDIDYLAALNNADEYTKDIYRREVMKIHTVHAKCYEISRKEEPYDVFISFKHKDDITGERTKSSVVAQEIYTSLTKEGLRVFYSPESLLAHAGENYEPYIYAALNSAKLMILVGDSREHVEARWVKNEWMRYLSIMDKDSSKTLVPICVGMSPYDLPKEFPPKLQAFEWGKIGLMQDIITGALKVTGKLNRNTASVAPSAKMNVANKLKAIERALEDALFSDATRIANEILDEYPENGDAHFYILLAANNAKSLDELSKDKDWEKDTRFRRAMQMGTEETKKKLETFLEECEKEKIYTDASSKMAQEQFASAAKLFEKIPGYKDSDKRCSLCIQRHNLICSQNEATKEITEEIGDKKTYMARTLHSRIPEQLAKYRQATSESYSGWLGSGRSIICMIAAVLLLVSGLFASPYNSTFLWGISLTVIVYNWFVMDFGIKTILMAFGFSAAPVIVMALTDSMFGSYMVGIIIYKIVTVIIFAWYLKQFIDVRKGIKAKKDMAEMIKIINVEVDKIKAYLKEKYTPVLGEDVVNSIVDELEFD